MLIVLRGLQTGVTGGDSLSQVPASFLYLGSASLAGHARCRSGSAAILFMLGIVVLGYFRHGRSLYAIGGNVDAAARGRYPDRPGHLDRAGHRQACWPRSPAC